MDKKDLRSLWSKTKKKFDKLEKTLIDCYISFLREVVKVYLQKKRKVFFKENRIVHWGESNFGELLIEGNEDVNDVFGTYIPEIRFELKIKEKDLNLRGYTKITHRNIKKIKYQKNGE